MASKLNKTGLTSNCVVNLLYLLLSLVCLQNLKFFWRGVFFVIFLHFLLSMFQRFNSNLIQNPPPPCSLSGTPQRPATCRKDVRAHVPRDQFVCFVEIGIILKRPLLPIRETRTTYSLPKVKTQNENVIRAYSNEIGDLCNADTLSIGMCLIVMNWVFEV